MTVEYPAATASSPTASCTVRIFNGVCSYMGMKTITIPACGGPGGGGDGGGGFCAGLLISAITLLVLGFASIVIGVCFNVPALTTAGGIAVGVGLVLMILWTLLCARFTPCGVMQTIQCILLFLVAVVGPIIAALAFFFGGGFLSACFGAAVLAWGGWGTLYAWLHLVMRQVGCHELC